MSRVSHRATAIKCAKEPAEREMREMLMRIGGDDPDERSKHGVPRQQDLSTTAATDTVSAAKTTATTTVLVSITQTSITKGSKATAVSSRNQDHR